LGKEVEDALPLEVDQDGAVGAAFLERPVVHAQDARWLGRRWFRRVDEAEHRVRARRHAQMRQESGAGLPAQGDADPCLGVGEPTRALGTWREELGKTLGEGALGAGGVAAVEPAHVQAEPHRAPERGQVGGMTHVAAVDGTADVATSRAAGLLAGTASSDVDDLWIEARDVIDAAARDGTELLHDRR
jgi:hypothetical protein